MAWNNQGGGGSPWGSGGGSSGGGGGGPFGPGGGQPPDLEDLLRRGQDKLRTIIPGGVGSSRGIIMILLIAAAIWGASGFYRVQPDEQGVVMRFGAWDRTTQPGLNYHLPVPIESAFTPKVTRVNRVEIGFRQAGGGKSNVPEESLMLTGDENIVKVYFTAFWIIKDAGKYLFEIRNPEQTVKAAAESAMREVIGRSASQKADAKNTSARAVASGILIQNILEQGRGEVQDETLKLTQRVLDDYGSGIQITQVQIQELDPPDQVIDAYRDVQRAQADKERLRNEAEAYRNDILPRARGQAAMIVQEAEGYKRQTVSKSRGESSRFKAVYEQYRSAPTVTRQRLYLEAMEEILSKNSKTVIDSKASGSGVVPYLPLPEVQKRSSQATGGTK
jgi:membrane protease subunit HflK